MSGSPVTGWSAFRPAGRGFLPLPRLDAQPQYSRSASGVTNPRPNPPYAPPAWQAARNLMEAHPALGVSARAEPGARFSQGESSALPKRQTVQSLSLGAGPSLPSTAPRSSRVHRIPRSIRWWGPHDG